MFFDMLTLIYSLKILPRESMTRYDRYIYNLYKGTTRVPRNNCRSLLEAPLLTIPFLEGSQHWHRWRSRRTCRRSCSSCRRSRRSRCWRRNPWVHNLVALSAHCWRAAAICTELCGCCLCPFESHSVGLGTQVPRCVWEWAAVRPNRAWSLPSSSKSSWTLLLRVFEKFSNVSFRDSCFLKYLFFCSLLFVCPSSPLSRTLVQPNSSGGFNQSCCQSVLFSLQNPRLEGSPLESIVKLCHVSLSNHIWTLSSPHHHLPYLLTRGLHDRKTIEWLDKKKIQLLLNF